MKHTIDELLIRKFEGWDMREYLFLSAIGHLSILDNFSQIEKSDNYYGLRGMSVCLVCSPMTTAQAYAEAEKLITAGVDNVAFWILGKPYVKELVFNGTRSSLEGNVTLSDGWNDIVQELARAAA